MSISDIATVNVVLKPTLKPVLSNVFGTSNTRYAYNMDGIDDRWTLANRAINLDGDIDIEFWTPPDKIGPQNILSQNIAMTTSMREFQIYVTNSPTRLICFLGGILTELGRVTPSTKYKATWIGDQFTLYRENGDIIRTLTCPRGASREPSAITVIGANTENAGIYRNFFQGIQRDLKINGTLWPMADRNQAIQLPEPSGLGAELITQSVLENPAVKGTQWTYLGNGRWQYVGDGTHNALSFINTPNLPPQGFLEFEVESISGVMTSSIGDTANSRFSSVGIFRRFYTSLAGNELQFKRSGSSVASCVIKNISFKPLGTCNPMTGANLNTDRWVEITR